MPIQPYKVPREFLPTPYESELLTILAEESCEVAQRASKLIRFGAQEIQLGRQQNNAERLMVEYYELQYIMDVLITSGLVTDDTRLREITRQRKRDQLVTFMQNDPPPTVSNT